MAQNEFADKYYEMNPAADDLLADGSMLENDMIVLIEDPSFKGDLKNMHQPDENYKLRKWNRWVKVSEFEYDEDSDTITFIGIYHDSTKKKITTSADHSWYVKLWSLATEAATDVPTLQNDDVEVIPKVEWPQMHPLGGFIIK